jgi:hypothetical protein
LFFILSAASITLSVKVDDPQATTQTLTLQAKPNELAEEKVGDCATFEGKADFLNGAKKFNATGEVEFKGKMRKIVIQYPEGYDPD